MKKIVFYATTNAGKFDEVKRYLEEHEPTIELKQFDRDLPEIQSTDQKAIAIDKATQAWNELKHPVLVDDSGFYFDYYNNFPGTMSKFVYYGIGFEGLLKLAEVDNRCTRRLHLVYKDCDETQHVFEGICSGKIIRPKSFDTHPKFPYDAIYLPNGSKKTMAELRKTPEEKNFSYRLSALKKFLAWFKEEE